MLMYVSSNDDILDWNVDSQDRIIQNVRNIIRTKKYEIPFLREMGIDPDFLGKPLREVENELKQNIHDIVMTHEPRVVVENVEILGLDQNGELNIRIELEV